MKVKDLKKIIDSYIKTHSADDEVVICGDNNEFEETSKVNFKMLKGRRYLETYTKTCGYEMDCHTPGKSCIERCKTCPDGGIGHQEVFKASKAKNAESVFAIQF